MWTAKRILILVLALTASLASYTTYSFFLGVIDGLRAFPVEWLPRPGESIGEGVDRRPHEADEKLEQAYGPGCMELQRPLRLWLPDKGIAFSAGDFTLDSGRVKLAPFSAALFHKSKMPTSFPEVSTIQCDAAWVTLDKPTTSFGDLNNRKVIAVEMQGRQIKLSNNRRTAEKSDDVDVLITNGHLFYEERKDMIWTDGVVRLTDNQSKPPTTIVGTGLEMALAKATNPNQPRAAKPATSASNDSANVERIKLRADVHMHFYVDARSGFLGGLPNTKKPPRGTTPLVLPDKKSPQAKAHIHIHTGGPFVYDLTKESAWFESPAPSEGAAGKGDPRWPDQVFVERIQTAANGVKTSDRLVCDRLDLQFRRKPAPPGANPANADNDKEIESAKAIKRGLTDVTVAAESENMHAFGTEMLYRAGDSINGPLTVLKGEPLQASKDGNRIKCLELHLYAANRYGEGQRAWAKGPGQIDLLDTKNVDKNVFPTHLKWQDELTVVSVKEGGQVFELMTVTGDASFEDEIQKQELHGDIIRAWIRKIQESERRPDAVGGDKQDLHRVVVQDRVRARSQEFIIRQAERFEMNFLPMVARNDRLPDMPAPKLAGPVTEPKSKNPSSVGAGSGPAIKDPAPPVIAARPPFEEKKKLPIELTAREIKATIASFGPKKQLQELIAKDNVYVFQAGEKPGEKALDIVGQLLTVKDAGAGATLEIYGEKNKLARLEIGDTVLWGPHVIVNQETNRADIEGAGAMDMPSNKNLDGSESTKKNGRLIILWNKNMSFTGQYATFAGGVEAYEKGGYSKVTCQALTAILDRSVSFKEGQKQNQNAKIDRLVFDKNVFIDNAKVDTAKQLEERHQFFGASLLNHQDGLTRGYGPGEVKILARGKAEIGLAAPMPKGKDAKPAKTEWRLTHVKFRNNMIADSKPNLKTATFTGYNSGVEVFHFGTVDINAKMNPDRPGESGLYLRCGILTVESRTVEQRTTQTMIAKESVEFKTEQYFGQADIVKFDESKDTIIFEAVPGNVVRLSKIEGNRIQPIAVNATKVLYNRKTGEVLTRGVKSLTN